MISSVVHVLIHLLLFLTLMAGTLPSLVMTSSEAARSQNDAESETLRETVVLAGRADRFRLSHSPRLDVEWTAPPSPCVPSRTGAAFVAADGHCLSNGLRAPLLI